MSLREEVYALDLEDLRNAEICYRCVAAGMSLENCLHSEESMMESEVTSDTVCLHCHDNERDLGYRRLERGKAKAVFKYIKEFERLRQERLAKEG